MWGFLKTQQEHKDTTPYLPFPSQWEFAGIKTVSKLVFLSLCFWLHSWKTVRKCISVHKISSLRSIPCLSQVNIDVFAFFEPLDFIMKGTYCVWIFLLADTKQSTVLPILSFISTLASWVLYNHAHFISNEGELQRSWVLVKDSS